MQAPVASSCLARQSKNGGDNMKDQIVNLASLPIPSTNNYSTECAVDCGTSLIKTGALTTTSTYLSNARDDSTYQNTSTEEPCGPTAFISLHGKDVTDGAVTRKLEDMVIFILSFLVLLHLLALRFYYRFSSFMSRILKFHFSVFCWHKWQIFSFPVVFTISLCILDCYVPIRIALNLILVH